MLHLRSLLLSMTPSMARPWALAPPLFRKRRASCAAPGDKAPAGRCSGISASISPPSWSSKASILLRAGEDQLARTCSFCACAKRSCSTLSTNAAAAGLAKGARRGAVGWGAVKGVCDAAAGAARGVPRGAASCEDEASADEDGAPDAGFLRGFSTGTARRGGGGAGERGPR